MSIEFALSVLDSTNGNAGLFTGGMTMEGGHVLPEIVFRVPSEAEAFATCWRAPSVAQAARISGMLLAFGPPGLDVQLVEIHKAGA